MVSIHVDDALYAKIAEEYERAKGTFVFTREGYPSFIVMRSSDLEEEVPLNDAEIRMLKKGHDEAQRGEIVGAFESLPEIRAAYGK